MRRRAVRTGLQTAPLASASGPRPRALVTSPVMSRDPTPPHWHLRLAFASDDFKFRGLGWAATPAPSSPGGSTTGATAAWAVGFHHEWSDEPELTKLPMTLTLAFALALRQSLRQMRKSLDGSASFEKTPRTNSDLGGLGQ